MNAELTRKESVKIMEYPNYLPDPEPEPVKPKKKKMTKAEKKERRLKAKQEFQKLEMRELLKRELELSKKSALRGREEWENMCREIKIVEMYEEVKAWDVKTQRVLKQKDDKIQMMLNDMSTTEEMHRRNFTKQLQIMDHLINCYRILVQTAKALYESQAAEAVLEFYQELNAKEEHEEKVRENCENIMHCTNVVMESQLASDYIIFMEKRSDLVNTEIEKRYVLRDSILEKMKAMRKHIINFVASLHNVALDVHKYERIRSLTERQRNFVIESQKLNDTEFRNTRIHSDLQRELLHIEVEAQRKTTDLRLEQAYFLQVRKSIENNMRIDRDITFEKLRVLSSEVYEMKKQYQKLAKYGELILSLAANCRKLETAAEKVVAGGEYHDLAVHDIQTDEEEEAFKLKVLDLAKHVDLSEEELAQQIELMKNFWRRQAIVEMQNLLLQEQQRKFTTENGKYIEIIKSMSKTDDVNELLKTITYTCIKPPITPCSNLNYTLRAKHPTHYRASAPVDQTFPSPPAEPFTSALLQNQEEEKEEEKKKKNIDKEVAEYI